MKRGQYKGKREGWKEEREELRRGVREERKKEYERMRARGRRLED